MKSMSFITVALRGLFQKPATAMYPTVPRVYDAATRGHIRIDVEHCTLCSLCVKKCPTDAIAVDRTAKTWTISRMRCIQCGACVEGCPKHCLSLANTYSPPSPTKTMDAFNVPYTPPARKPAAADAPAAHPEPGR